MLKLTKLVKELENNILESLPVAGSPETIESLLDTIQKIQNILSSESTQIKEV